MKIWWGRERVQVHWTYILSSFSICGQYSITVYLNFTEVTFVTSSNQNQSPTCRVTPSLSHGIPACLWLQWPQRVHEWMCTFVRPHGTDSMWSQSPRLSKLSIFPINSITVQFSCHQFVTSGPRHRLQLSFHRLPIPHFHFWHTRQYLKRNIRKY